MRLVELVGTLDTTFALCGWERDPAMSRWVPRVYRSISCDYTKVLEPDFCDRFNGLMLRSGDTVRKAYCAAFPTPEILRTVLAGPAGGALLFLHHPVDLEVAGVGFLPVPPEMLMRLKARNISVYTCHAPMDCHETMGTSASIAQAFEVEVSVEKRFDPYGPGFSGIVGTVAKQMLADLAEKGKQIFSVDRVEIGGARPASITRVAIVAGGADSPDLMAEAESLGAQAYITGEWYPRTSPPDEAGRTWAETNRAACRAFAETTGMALLGFSHPATEFLVMKRHMADFFKEQGLAVECLPQSDWWR